MGRGVATPNGNGLLAPGNHWAMDAVLGCFRIKDKARD